MLLYFDFDVKMDMNLLLKLITEVEERAEAKVSCVVLDMGNQGILKELGTYGGETKVIFLLKETSDNKFVCVKY